MYIRIECIYKPIVPLFSLFFSVTVCAFPYILAFTQDSIEIRLIINGNLVQTMVMPKLAFITSKVSGCVCMCVCVGRCVCGSTCYFLLLFLLQTHNFLLTNL